MLHTNKLVEKEIVYTNGIDVKELRKLEEKEFWKNVYLAVAGSSNCVNKDTCKKWANYALNDFRETFKNEQNER